MAGMKIEVNWSLSSLRRPVLLIPLLGMAAVATILALVLLGPVRRIAARQSDPGILYGRYLAHAEEAARLGLIEEADAYYQAALGLATNQESRLDCILGMTEHQANLLGSGGRDRARLSQYAEVLLGEETRPDRRLRVYRALLAVADDDRDHAALLALGAKVYPLISDPRERAANIVSRARMAIQRGGFSDVWPLMPVLETHAGDPEVADSVAILKAMVDERIAEDEAWGKAWSLAVGKPIDASQCARFRQNSLDAYVKLAEKPLGWVSSEAILRTARLLMAKPDPERAVGYLAEFIARSPGEHAAEAMELIVRYGQLTQRTQAAESMFAVGLDQFPWNLASADEMLSVVDLAVRRGRQDEALKLIGKYVNLPDPGDGNVVLLLRGVSLAIAMEKLDLAENMAARLLAVPTTDAQRTTALLSMVEISRRRGQLDKAGEWVAQYLAEYPYNKNRGEVLMGLFEIEYARGSGPVMLVGIALEAVNEKTDDPRALSVLLRAAAILEKMGLHSLAQDQYHRVAVLFDVSDLASAEDSPLKREVLKGMLGSARCCYHLGETLRADLVLRDICNRSEPGPILAEAAYYWGLVACENRQFAEAKRRLGLVDPAHATPEILMRTGITRQLIEIGSGKARMETVTGVVKDIRQLPAGEHNEYIRQAYRTCLDRLEELGALDAMQQFFRDAATGPHARILPLSRYSMRIGSRVLAASGLEAFSKFAREGSELMAAVGGDSAGSLRDMSAVAASISLHTERLKKHL